MAPARQHGARSYRPGNGSTLKDLDQNGIDYLSDVWKLCTRMRVFVTAKKLLLLLAAKFSYLCVAVTHG